ncbi:AAA domain (dynein-related subfamily) [Halogranum amylolyticum]|uniref:AAA domain (Dynein-related subfamily) n=1 Tax=Halogranum amylolyticum TaxID=660520 RepID=A0A1H8VV71_9EURY|nr:DUF3578 domain-containing protein [Halogranum amylolyticum]SEP19291.1 AAA domain (dynein-related subfamily) [Halogranum amylolyticum]
MNSSSTDLSELLQQALAKYPVDEIGEGKTANVARDAIEEQIPAQISELLADTDLVVEGSAGQGRWTSIPWVAIMDPRETTAIQNGIYVVYLFEPQEDRVTLTLNQGVTTLKNNHGMKQARERLRSIATAVSTELQLEEFSTGPLEFPHSSQRNKLYGPGTIVYKQYTLAEFPDAKTVTSDLQTLVAAYQSYVTTNSPSGQTSIIEDFETDSEPTESTGRKTTSETSTPTVYQVPIKSEAGPIRTNYNRTILDGVPREVIEYPWETPMDAERLCIWGNQADDPAEIGDYLLFADRDGRYDGEYTLLARVADATRLDAQTARQFTDAVGWGDVSDETYPHVLLLEPVWNATLDREEFWETLGFKGWPNDTYSAIDFNRDGSTFFSKYDSVDAFLEQIKGHAKSFDEDGERTAISDPAEDYESLEAALTDIRDRLAASSTGTAWLQSRIGDAIIEDWSTALDGFKPSDEVSARAAASFDQLRAVYETLEPELTDKADILGIGSLSRFSPAKTLFLGWVRILQTDLEIPHGLLSQPRLNSILRETYTVSTDTASAEETDLVEHPLTDHITTGEPTLYKFTAPPDYWLTAYEYTALAFEDADRETWDRIENGDIILFHSTAQPGWEAVDEQNAGLIGAGIVRTKTMKPVETQWWYDERQGRPRDDSFPYLVTFERLFGTGSFTHIDFEANIFAKSSERVSTELQALTSDALPFAAVNSICEEVADSGFPRHQTVLALDDSKATALIEALSERLQEVAPIAVHKSFDGTLDADTILEGLYFPGGQGEEIISQIEGTLKAGKHTILTGPPGTGKTAIAHRVGEYLATEYPYLYSGSQVTTATADWSTFDTVGGYMPHEDDADGHNLEFTPGLVLNRFKDRTTNTQRNESLVIDELNRADIDKAFGQLFTVLSGQPVQLPYTRKGQEVELTPVDTQRQPAAHEYRIPTSWNLFATLNTYDKTSLYEMSYAFMRRFSFIRVPAPTLDGRADDEIHALLENYAQRWQLDVDALTEMTDTNPLLDVGLIWQAANGAIEDRAIGPAVVKDILEYLTQTQSIAWERRLTQAVVSYIFPQLEGIPKRGRVVRSIADVDCIDRSLLDTAAKEMLQVAAIQETDG